MLHCRHDEQDEAKLFDDYAVGIYKTVSSGEKLIGHVSIELSFLFSKFIEKEENEFVAEVKGGRKLEKRTRCASHLSRPWRSKTCERLPGRDEKKETRCSSTHGHTAVKHQKWIFFVTFIY